MKGYWVVFEDIDKAPADVQSIILPLLESASSFLTGHGEVIYFGQRFMSWNLFFCSCNWSELVYKNAYVYVLKPCLLIILIIFCVNVCFQL